ncbi:MAG: flagellar basal body FlgE domain-containing protein, partial [Gammaproteobacteria bacterium]|nr:flagellar basal body FlgE domain-containing protein [Gammaproteobacteria bacterium]
MLADFSTDEVSFEVTDGTNPTTVTFSADYTSNLSGLVAALGTALGSNYVVTNPSGNNIQIESVQTGTGTSVSVGSFNADADGNTINSVVTEFPAVTSVDGDNAVPASILAINPLDPTTYNNSTSATVFDSLGNEHIVTTYYQKIDAES